MVTSVAPVLASLYHGSEFMHHARSVRLRIGIICPAPPGSQQGNRITAVRWARILRTLGHCVHIAGGLEDDDPDLLIALHARRSADAAAEYRRRHPDRALVVALTGTDLYGDLEHSRSAQRSLAMAERLVVLQSEALAALPPLVRDKTRVIHQSAVVPRRRVRRTGRYFDVCVLSHLRTVKDPLRAAAAARRLADDSRVRVLHAGRALTKKMALRARREMNRNPRYHWLGERSHSSALALLARARILVLSSRLEGGANVIGEAAVRAVPVLASRVPGNVGLLGPDYPGLFAVADTGALAILMRRTEADESFYARLQRRVAALAPLFRPSRERRAWRELIRELTIHP